MAIEVTGADRRKYTVRVTGLLYPYPNWPNAEIHSAGELIRRHAHELVALATAGGTRARGARC